MKKRFIFMIGVLLLWCCVLAGCEQKEELPEQFPSDTAGNSGSSLLSSESGYNMMTDVFEVTEYHPQCFSEFYCPPSLLSGEYLLSGQKNAATVSADTFEEKELDFFAYEVQADKDNYYWMFWEAEDQAVDEDLAQRRIEVKLMQTNKETLDSRVLLTIEDGSSVMTRLSIYDSFLVWLEEHGDEEPLWYIQKYDLKTGENSEIYVFSPAYSSSSVSYNSIVNYNGKIYFDDIVSDGDDVIGVNLLAWDIKTKSIDL